MYYYQYTKRLKKEGIYRAAQAIKSDPLQAVSHAVKLWKVYYIFKRRFFAEATQDEMNTMPVLNNGLVYTEDTHRILQYRLMCELIPSFERCFYLDSWMSGS